MKRTSAAVLCLATLAGAAQIAYAQEKAPVAPGTGTPPSPPVTSAPPEVVAPNQAQGQTLSSSLAQSNGTLRPPAVDPEMQKTPAERGTMPVIPPPGTPGGAPGMVPK
jgi:hypothetical protein